jgi:small-conductance mechanosensitive channel
VQVQADAAEGLAKPHIVPNSTIAKSKIVNVSSPSGVHGTTVTVELDAKTPPAIGTEILEHPC